MYTLLYALRNVNLGNTQRIRDERRGCCMTNTEQQLPCVSYVKYRVDVRCGLWVLWQGSKILLGFTMLQGDGRMTPYHCWKYTIWLRVRSSCFVAKCELGQVNIIRHLSIKLFLHTRIVQFICTTPVIESDWLGKCEFVSRFIMIVEQNGTFVRVHLDHLNKLEQLWSEYWLPKALSIHVLFKFLGIGLNVARRTSNRVTFLIFIRINISWIEKKCSRLL